MCQKPSDAVTLARACARDSCSAIQPVHHSRRAKGSDLPAGRLEACLECPRRGRWSGPRQYHELRRGRWSRSTPEARRSNASIGPMNRRRPVGTAGPR
ncbi:conserved hypothetical protein [Ricinus communis]|uniref:Uncharacterized protein n=1 Tax=Ricinus communis TaxID=3988 RepID=B9TGY2_RICCO|nr:conserved hypothetical protein [Ricinus communis]